MILNLLTNAIKLTSTNYITWKAQIKSILIGYDLFKFVDGTHSAPTKTITTNSVTKTNPAYTTWMRQDQLLYGALVSTLASNVAPLITQAETTQEAWKILEETYAKPSRGHINQLKDKLKNLKKGNQSITDFMQQVKGCSDILASLGKPQDPEDIIDYVLRGLDSTFQAVVDAVQNRESMISFAELHEKLINKELQLKNEGASSPLAVPVTAMMMQSKSKPKHRPNTPTPVSTPPIRPGTSQPYYHTSPPQPPSQYQPPPYLNRPPSRPFRDRCQWCRETGHVVAYCPIFRQAAPNLRPPPRPVINHNYSQPPFAAQVHASTLNHLG